MESPAGASQLVVVSAVGDHMKEWSMGPAQSRAVARNRPWEWSRKLSGRSAAAVRGPIPDLSITEDTDNTVTFPSSLISSTVLDSCNSCKFSGLSCLTLHLTFKHRSLFCIYGR